MAVMNKVQCVSELENVATICTAMATNVRASKEAKISIQKVQGELRRAQDKLVSVIEALQAFT